MAPSLLTTLGLLLDIVGAWLLAWDVFRARAFLGRHAALEQVRELNTRRRQVMDQADEARREGISGPSFDMHFTSPLRDLDWRIEDLEEKLSSGELRYRLTISCLAKVGAVCLTLGFGLQALAQWPVALTWLYHVATRWALTR